MIDQDELEVIHRAAELAGHLAVMVRVAGPMLEELAGLLERLGNRPTTILAPLELVDPPAETGDVGGKSLHPLNKVG
jgi:hypothetical protein